MRRNILYLAGAVCVLASCVEEKIVVEPTPGQEVNFNAGMSSTQTKTLYGADADNATGIKVKWVDGDMISVYGTTCSVKYSDYSVSAPAASTANADDGQNYADELTKTGTAGVQWGNAASDFYAVYPSVDAGDISADGSSATIKTSINASQYNEFIFDATNKIWKGVPYDAVNKKQCMNDAIMYACSPQVQNGSVVDLNFKPFSTVLKFRLAGWEGNSDTGLATDQTGKSIIVTQVTLTAPQGTGIAGDFDLNVSYDANLNVTASASTASTANTIVISPTEQLTWAYGEALEFSVFTIPVEKALTEGWIVTVSALGSNGTFTKTFKLKPTTTTNTLAAGKIHKIKVDKMPVDAVWEYKPETWMTTIPRNVYIADLSLPGSWYACDSGYQGGSLEEQYAAGIRAFNVDCRLTLAVGKSVRDYGQEISSGVRPDYEYIDNEAHVTDGTLVLACSGTESRNTGSYSINSIGKTVKQALIELGKLATENTNEYVEVILTCAQKPKQENATGSQLTMGTVNAKMMYTAIANVLNDAEVTPYLYTDPITPNTTLGNVKGKVVVKVNMNTDNSNLVTWNEPAPALFSEGTMAESADVSRSIKQANFTSMNSPAMYWSNTFTPAAGNEMVFHYHQAQNTTGESPFPTVDDRKKAIESIITQSYAEYSSNGHNGWYQIGIGGWTDNSDYGKAKLSSELNPYLLGIINEMLAGTRDPAPVGAVLMNLTTTESMTQEGGYFSDDVIYTFQSADLIKAIIDLNGAYFLNRDTTQEPWPDSETKTLPASNGAYAYVGEDAF